MTYLIQSAEGEALPHYLMVSRFPGASAWTPMTREAMKFESIQAADEYVAAKLSRLRVFVVPMPSREYVA